MRVRRALTIVLACAGSGVASCNEELPPQGQVVLHLDTDAPVAPADDFARPAPLFDRVLVEIFPPGKGEPCAGCVRELPVDAEKMHASRYSFGFVPRPRDPGWRARLRLVRSAGRATPRSESTIELVGYLPAVAEDGVVPLTATFRTEDVGRPRGTLSEPVIFERGAPPRSAEGTWSGARVEGCAAPPPRGAVCVPGGAFFMGDPRVTVDQTLVGGAKEHLVVLSSFFVDEREVTVADVRASGLAVLDSRGRARDPLDDSNDALGESCSYTAAPGPNELLPVGCVSHELATRFCEARGGMLPTEAQLEMVASRRGTRLAPWGDREPGCDDAVVARGTPRDAGGCGAIDPLAPGTRVLPEAAGSGALDRVDVGGAIVVDLGANLREWARDSFARDDEPCWRDVLLHDPVCRVPGRAERTTKGGDLVGVPVDYAQLRRSASSSGGVRVGFRCVYPGKP